jgi:hypothetical protein
MGSFGSVIPVTGLNVGFPGQVSRTGDLVIAARQANPSNAHNISFGQACMLLGDTIGGTLISAADFFANGGGYSVGTVSTHGTTTLDTLALTYPVRVNQFLYGSGIPAGAQVTAITPTTITMSKAATSSGSGVALYASSFAGIAIREVKTNVTSYLGMEQTGSNTPVVGYYAPGEMTEVIERGSVAVQIAAGVPFAGAPVYIRTALNGSIPAGLIGDLEGYTQGDGGLVPVDNSVVFRTGVLDANNVAEITLLPRVAA